MFGVNNKGRYGFLISIITTMFDFVLLNVAYIYILHQSSDAGQFGEKVVWVFANLSYAPAIMLFPEIHNKRVLYVDRIMIILVQSFIVYCISFFSLVMISGYDEIPIKTSFNYFLITYALLCVWWVSSRKLIKFIRSKGYNYKRIVIVGWNPTARRLYEEIQSDSGYGYRIIGIFDNSPKMPGDTVSLTGKISEISEFLEKNVVDELYCSLPSEENEVGKIIKMADNHDIVFYHVPLISGFMTTTFSLTTFGNIPLLVYRPNPLQHLHNRCIKRLFDIVVSLIAILLVSCTVLIPIIIAIKLSSKGPILFKQLRTGYKGREFVCLKFRTMRVNSESDDKQATKDDPRKTKVGDFLRKTSLDELPQFLNVLWGNMSVVGPRPHMVKQTDEYRKLIDRYMVRHIIKPGITGLAQVSGYRGQTEELWQMEKRVEYDVTYIENWTFWLDIKIVIRTIVNAIRGEKNAY